MLLSCIITYTKSFVVHPLTNCVIVLVSAMESLNAIRALGGSYYLTASVGSCFSGKISSFYCGNWKTL